MNVPENRSEDERPIVGVECDAFGDELREGWWYTEDGEPICGDMDTQSMSLHLTDLMLSGTNVGNTFRKELVRRLEVVYGTFDALIAHALEWPELFSGDNLLEAECFDAADVLMSEPERFFEEYGIWQYRA